MASNVSAGLIFRNKKLLMFFNEEQEVWDVPSAASERGEISADAATRIAEEFAGCQCSVLRYKKSLKVEMETGATLFPYLMNLEGSPERGNWKSQDEVEELSLAPHLEEKRSALISEF